MKYLEEKHIIYIAEQLEKSLEYIDKYKADTSAKKDRLDLTKKKLIIENYDDILYRMTDAFDTDFDYMPEEGGPVDAALIEELKAWKSSLDQVSGS